MRYLFIALCIPVLGFCDLSFNDTHKQVDLMDSLDQIEMKIDILMDQMDRISTQLQSLYDADIFFKENANCK